jgi:PIN domain nuclease of toxin-antitoxin system
VEAVIFLDTHATVWLYAGEVERFPRRAQARLETEALVISPIVVLELQYLHEVGRVIDGPTLIVKELEKALGLSVKADDFERIILSALAQSWTRDPFDRIIVAQAQLNSAPLLSKDETIRRHYRRAFWA